MLRRPVTAFLQARLARPVAPQSQPFELCIRTFSHAPRLLDQPAPTRRPGRPKGVVGEPSRPVKRSVKRNAQKPASTGEDAAAEKTSSRKKTAAKKKAAPKKPKKVMTEEQRERQKKRLQSAKLSELKKAALKPPKVTASSAYTEYQKEQTQGSLPEKMKGKSSVENRTILGENSRQISQGYRNLSASEIEHYNHLAHTHTETKRAELKRWVESHTPEEIAIANTARAALRRKEDRKKNHRTKYPAIHDERAVKRGISAYIQFNLNRQASGDFKHIPMTERAKLIGQEWKALSEEEKRKYKNLEQGEKERYQEEYTSVYGHPPGYASSIESANAVSVSA